MPTLNRFLEAQNQTYIKALSEIKKGQKQSHWMWYIFPQIKGLGKSEMTNFYALKDVHEAEAYLQHPILGKHLLEISAALLEIKDKSATAILGTPDDLKLHSSMTLFAEIADKPNVFENILNHFYNGSKDEKTLNLIY